MQQAQHEYEDENNDECSDRSEGSDAENAREHQSPREKLKALEERIRIQQKAKRAEEIARQKAAGTWKPSGIALLLEKSKAERAAAGKKDEPEQSDTLAARASVGEPASRGGEKEASSLRDQTEQPLAVVTEEDKSVPIVKPMVASGKRQVASQVAKQRRYPVDAFGTLAPVITAIATAVQVSPAMVGGVMIAILSSILQAFFNVSQRLTGAGMPLSLNVFLIADSGERKSSTVHAVAKPLYAALRNVLDTRRRMLVQDVTVDGLVVGLISRCPAQFLLVLEAAALFSSHAMSKDNLMRFLGIVSSLFSGEPISRTRVDEHHYAEDRRLNALVISQPVVATEFLSSDLVMNQGLGNRFIYDDLEPQRGTRQYKDDELENHPAYQSYCDTITALVSREMKIDEVTGGVATKVIRPSPEAKVIWVDFYNRLEDDCREGGRLAAHASYAGRLAEQSLRIGGVLTLVDDSEANEITTDAMQRAVQLSEYYLDAAVQLFSKAPANTDERHAQMLLEWMREKQLELKIDAIPVRMMYKDGPRCARPSKRTRELLSILEERGEIVKYEHTIQYGTNGKSSENYAVV